MDLEDERVLFLGIKSGRFGHPALDWAFIKRGFALDLFGLPKLLESEQSVVEPGDAFDFSGSFTTSGDIGGMIGTTMSVGEPPIGCHREGAAAVWSAGRDAAQIIRQR